MNLIYIMLIMFSSVNPTHGKEIRPPVGVLNSEVTQENLNSTVCKPNWTSTIRPSSSYTNKLKLLQVEDKSVLKDYEEDHFIPLSVGGHPTDKNNLWAQSWYGTCGAKEKDKEEVRIHKRLCNGEITLKEAQEYFFKWRCR